MWMEALESRLFLDSTLQAVIIRNTPDPGPGLESYTVHFVADSAADECNAFDGAFTGPMNQVWAYSNQQATPTADSESKLSAADWALDTHLLLMSANIVAVHAPTEDRDATTGLGTYLGGGPGTNMSFGMMPETELVDLPFAQIVIPTGGAVHLIADLSTASGLKVHIDTWVEDSTLTPTMALNATPISLGANYPAVALAPTATLAEPRSAPAGATLTFTLGSAATAGDQFLIANQGTDVGQVGVSGSSVSYGGTVVGTFTGGTNGTDLTVTFNASATSDAMQAVLRDVTFTYASAAAPPQTARTVSVVFTDPVGYVIPDVGGSNDISVTVTYVNQPPVVTVPGSVSVVENTPVVFSDPQGNAIGIADPDVGNGLMRITLDATEGTLSLATTVGVTIYAGSAANSSHIVFDSTEVTAVAALNGLTFTPAENYVGNATINILVSDKGNTGTGGPQTDSGGITVTLTANPNPNTPPTAGDLTQNVDLSKPTQFSLPIHDAESSLPHLTINIISRPTEGTLQVLGSGVVQYTPNSHITGTDSFTYTVSDDGLGGTPIQVMTSPEATVTLTLGRTATLDAKGKLTYLDGNGQFVAVSLTGGGTGTLYFDTAAKSNPALIELDGTTTKSVLNFTPVLKKTYTTIGDITVNGPIGKITGGLCDLHGAIVSIGSTTISTASAALTFHDVTNSSIMSAMPLASLSVLDWQNLDGTDTITATRLDKLTSTGNFGADLALSGNLGTATVGGGLSNVNWGISGSVAGITVTGATSASIISIGPTTTTKTAALTFHDVTNSSITSQMAVGSLSVTDWQNTDGTDTITATRLDKLTSTSKLINFGANLNLSGKLGTATLGANLSHADWNVAAITGLTVTGTADTSVIRSAGSIGSMTFGAVSHTDVLAGIRPAAAQETLRHAAASGDFLSQVASIGKITIKGWSVGKKTPQMSGLQFFVDSNFSAASIGTATILNADFATATDGLWVLNTIIPKPVKSVSYKDALTKWTYTKGVDPNGCVHLIAVV